MTETENVPEWAVREICRRTGESYERFKAGSLSSGVARIIRVAAEILAAHEEEPVDPLLVEAREIAAEACVAANNPQGADRILSGDWDDQEGLVSTALRALRRGIELARKDSQ